MKKLYRHELDFKRTVIFIKDNLNKASALSDEILNSVDFAAGRFFTLLPDDSDLDRLYEFEGGVILPQNPIIETEVNGIKSRHSITPTIKDELSEFIFNKINTNEKLSCVFDDVLRSPQSSHLKLFYEKNALFLYENEVIYVIRNYNNDLEFILECIWHSFGLWHSLGVLTETDCFNGISKNIFNLENIKNICKKANTIMVSAYDGEGYVFWEKDAT